MFSRYEDGQTVITQRYAYTEYENGERMLYDLESDPEENVNIAGLPNNEVLVRRLSGMLSKGWKSFVPEPVDQRE